MNGFSSPRNGKLYHWLRGFLINVNRDLMDITAKVKRESYVFDDFDYLVMALEDRRYLKHRGVDLISVIREILKMLTCRRHGGASTIDMQMVRTLTNYRELTFKRKIYEIILAWLINFRFSKNEIMNCYMSNAFFGSHLIGVNKACMSEYGKDLDEISYHEKARLAAMLLRPRPKNPTADWDSFVESRAAYAQSMRRRVKCGS